MTFLINNASASYPILLVWVLLRFYCIGLNYPNKIKPALFWVIYVSEWAPGAFADI